MNDKIISSNKDMSCPFCNSKKLSQIFLKNFKQALDSYFFKIKSPKNLFEKPLEPIKDPIKIDEDFLLLNQAHFFKCQDCECVFRNLFYILPENEEHQRYYTHNNNLEDPKYIDYLNQSITPFLKFIGSNDEGLDFGCGPTKGIEFILKTQGVKISSYDKYFYPDAKETQFDFIFCHEVVEHFVHVRQEFENLVNKLKPNGRIFIRTETHPDDFENWYYKNDSTHVFFFSDKTFEKLAQVFNLEFLKLEKNKFVLSKK